MTEWLDRLQVQDRERRKLANAVVAIFEVDNGELTRVIGSGFLKDKWKVVTARHVAERDITDLRCVLGFWDDIESNEIPKEQQYRIEDRVLGHDSDWAYLLLVDEVEGYETLSIGDSDDLSDNDQAFVFVIGHPSGETVKFSPDCPVSNISNEDLEVELAPVNCLSGAPVINSRTLKVEGIISEGVGIAMCVRANAFA